MRDCGVKMLAHIENLVRSIAEKQGLCITQVDIRTGKKKGDGFLSDIHLVSATNGNGGRLDVAVKCATENQVVADKFHIREVFENEEQFYSRVFPTLLRYQDAKHVSDAFRAVPRYFGSDFGGEIRLLALEDLRSAGFELFDKKATVNKDHVEKVLREYGKFHAVSFVYKLEQRENFDEITGKLDDCWMLFMDGTNFKDLINAVCEDVASVLEEEGEAFLVKYFKKYEDGGDIIKSAASYKGEYSTLTHGDCWSNNFMFRYEQSDDGQKEVKNVRILDWQLLRIGTPVYDLSYFLYSNGSKSIFDELEYYLNLYYESFSKMVRDLGHEPEDIYPVHVLKAEWKKYSLFGFLLGLFVQRAKLTCDEDIIDLNDIKDMGEDKESRHKHFSGKYDRKVYSERAVGLVKHMSEIDVL